MVSGKNNKGAWKDMTPCIEVKMLIKTDEGDMNVNFYTTVEFPYSLNPNDFDDYFCESVSDSVDEVLARMKQSINSGWAYRKTESSIDPIKKLFHITKVY